MKTEYKIALIAILMIFGLEVLALSKGIDGAVLTASVGAIGVIVGYVVKSAIGAPGERGPRGDKGEAGESGKRGERGARGDRGEPGV